MGGEQLAQRRRAGLLFAFDEHGDADRGLAVERPHRRQMCCDTGLVVGSAAAVQPAVALGRLERCGDPLARVALGLHVVVGVQQDGRRAGRGGVAGYDGRGTALADDAHIVEPDSGEQVGDRLCAAVHLVATTRVGPYRLDADQIFEIRTD